MNRLVAPSLTSFLGLLLFVACGGKSTQEAPEPADASLESSTGNAFAGREPKEHRASASACPTERGAVLPNATDCAPDQFTKCLQDSDCTQGNNGRCEGRGCGGACYYDDCFSDSDCTGSACLCRASASDSSPNFCATAGDCRTDSDCGQGGYCSPSLVGYVCVCTSPAFCDGSCGPDCTCGNSCGQGYYCHTKRDTCVDDTDCTGGGRCAFDLVEKRFSCEECALLP
jgi:hypothetical protein